MSIATDLRTFFRNRWAERFTETLTVATRADRVYNAGTGQYDAESDTPIYSGSGLVRPSADASATGRGGTAVELGRYDVYIAHDAATISPGAVVTVSASVGDAELVGLELRVDAVERDSYKHHTRLICQLNEGAADDG